MSAGGLTRLTTLVNCLKDAQRAKKKKKKPRRNSGAEKYNK